MIKKLLLICPKFMEYEKKIIEYVNVKYQVRYMNSEEYLRDIRKEYNALSIYKRAFYKVFKLIRGKKREDMLNKLSFSYESFFDINKNNDIVLIINGDSMSNDTYKYLKEKNPNAKFILYIWDDVKGLFKNSQFAFFDCIYSYNIDDCSKYGFKYLPIFTEKINIKKNEAKVYDIAIVATANKERVQIAKKLYEKYCKYLNFYIYFYSPELKYDFYTYKEPLTYQNYLNILNKSKIVFEMVRHNQSGPTTRFYDALETNTKVITTNKNIKKYPVYGKNIYVINKRMNILQSFIDSPYENENKHPMHIDNWMEVLEI